MAAALTKPRMKTLVVFTTLAITAAVVNIQLLRPYSADGNIHQTCAFQGEITHMFELKYRPWSDDPECQNYFVQFISNASQPPMALVSYPGSGNTWTRGSIERLTGYFTGSAYTDKDHYMKGFYGEMVSIDCGCTIVQKTHEIRDQVIQVSNGSRIVIIRNPYEALRSYRNFMTSGENHVQHGTDDFFNGSDWDNFVTIQIMAWRDKMFNWIPAIRHGGVLHYEKLIHDQSNELRKLLQYLNLTVDEPRLKCFLRHQYTTFQRNATVQHSRNLYTSEQRAFIDAAIASVQELLLNNNYESLPYQYYRYFNETHT